MNNEELLYTLQGMFEKNVEEVKRHTGVLVEDLRREVKLVAEGHSILDNKIDKFQAEITGVKRDITGIKQDMSEVKRDIRGIKQDLNTVKDYVIAVDDKLNNHDKIIKRIK
ncbi:MAG: hypothetical protein GX783_08450 [Clostridiales bacterium]|nr:hypothetical protein [Clostridiales bacterium]